MEEHLINKKAFTLAEVLITLAIIGIVAALTIPSFMKNFQEKVRTSRIQNIEQKLSKATDKMMVIDGLNGYGTTQNFVNTLSKHLKITKICTPQNIKDCWPTDTVKVNGKDYKIEDVKTSSNLKLENKYDNPIGIVTVDGASMIISYNKNCNISYSKGIQQQGDLSTSTSCIAGVFEINGKQKPNKMGDDVVSLNGGILGYDCVDVAGGKYCINDLGLGYDDYSPVCTGETGISSYCDWWNNNQSRTNIDRWTGAQRACEAKGLKLPSKDELLALYKLKGQDGVPTSSVYWSSTERDSYTAWGVFFSNGYLSNQYKYSQNRVLCVGG